MKEVLRLDHGVLTHFPASAGRNKPALILCPGGGYEYCSIREGAPVARAFARDGVEAFVLEYDCTEAPLGVKPLHTLSASVAWVRAHAAQLGIAADRIAVGGFSAGAHLAGLLAATWHDADWFPAGTKLQAHRPNAAVLCYRWSRRERMHTAAALCVWQAKMLRNSRGFHWKRWFPRTCRARFCGTP